MTAPYFIVELLANHRRILSDLGSLRVKLIVKPRLITASHYQTLANRPSRLKPQTILHSIHVIRGAWKHAKKLGYRVVEIEWPVIKREQGRLRYLSVDEEKRLLRELDPKRIYGPNHQQDPRFLTIEKRQARQDNHDLVISLLDTGARYGEIASLEWTQIDLENRTIQLQRSKTDNQSILYMTDRLYGVLMRRLCLPGPNSPQMQR